MPHDVFISYSSKDKNAADAVCAVLERNGIRCWIAPRDVLPGMAWGSAIITAIQSVKVCVLVFSGAANQSPQIEREIERAINKGIPVVPFRIEDVRPSNSLEYFISASHWLDAFTQPMEQHLETLAKVVRHLIALKEGSAPGEADAAEHTAAAPTAALNATPPPRSGSVRWMIIGSLAVALVVGVVFGAVFLMAPGRPLTLASAGQGPASPPAPQHTEAPPAPPTPAPPPAATPPPATEPPAAANSPPPPPPAQHSTVTLTGRWSWSAICGTGSWQGKFDIGEISAGHFTGKFGGTAWYDVGTISDGILEGTRVSFTRTSGAYIQKWKGDIAEQRMSGSVAADTYSCTWQAAKD